MPHVVQIETFQETQGLAQIRPLGPGAALAHGITPIIHHHRVLDPGAVGSQILPPQEATLLDVKRFQFFGNIIALFVAAVKAIAGGLQFLLAATACQLLLFDHTAQRKSQPGMPLLLSHIEQCQRRRHHFFQAFAAVVLQGGDAQIDDCGHRCHFDITGGNAIFHVPVYRRRRQRRRPLTGKHLYLLRRCRRNNQRHFAADTAGAVIGDIEGENGGRSRIGGIAVLLQNSYTRRHRFGPSRCHCAAFAGSLPIQL